MIIKLKNLSIPFHRLGLGAILISPDDSRYLKSLTDDAEFCWVTWLSTVFIDPPCNC